MSDMNEQELTALVRLLNIANEVAEKCRRGLLYSMHHAIKSDVKLLAAWGANQTAYTPAEELRMERHGLTVTKDWAKILKGKEGKI